MEWKITIQGTYGASMNAFWQVLSRYRLLENFNAVRRERERNGNEAEQEWVQGHRPVTVKRALIGLKVCWKLSTIIKLNSASWLVNNKIMGKNHIRRIYISCTFWKTISAFVD